IKRNYTQVGIAVLMSKHGSIQQELVLMMMKRMTKSLKLTLGNQISSLNGETSFIQHIFL
ncbi:hypothetical protein SQ11_16025, partial [Nitrosospira sp. NpAV]